ncbi:glycosyltransferase [Photobacterium iliopiscarium]|jgi:glycosyltransferase involved in cell wall biosynthesis|uniref:Glycosyl transferase family 1 domain-containing protein n=1 Tax=Photobacterium iliopiscarium TaxID=56192 RepID=A0A2T3MDE4_9GAMM|nr:glycosyltransferase [Photobacterium iliopiscarium]PST98225.1 hypothetical protein C9I85_16040 [Photobacterium iliopiscarium]PSV83348.1 hypothetical protein C9J51_08570 [Photobacterium iliopiscarium]PSV91688.1 hypothetical protein C9I88_16900 [Photobacterium iliopiscarium]
MKKILILHNSTKTAYLFRFNYIKSLISKGHKVKLLSVSDDYLSEEKLKEIGVELVLIKKSRLSTFFLYKELLTLGRWADVIISHFLACSILLSPILFLFRNKVTVVVEGLGTLGELNHRFLYFIKKIVSLISVKRVFMNGDEYSKLGKKGDLVLNGIGIELEKYKNNNNEILNNKIKICYVGRLIRQKGVDDLFKIIGDLNQEGFEFEFHFFGDIYPSNPSSLNGEDILKFKNKFKEQVFFHGFKQPIMQYIDKMNVLILPSRREGFPVVVMEANALGIPVLCYNVPGCIDSVTDGINGFIFEYGDYLSMSKKIIQLSSFDKNSFEELSNSCVKLSKDNFDANDKSAIFIRYILGN